MPDSRAAPPATASVARPSRPGDTSLETNALAWLLRLRYFALVGQSLAILVAALYVPEVVYLPGLIACLLLAVTLTLVAKKLARHLAPAASLRWCAGLLLVDTIQLTLMLHWAGGAHNPFTSFYLLHIALAAMLLSRRWALGIAALAILGFGALHQNALEVCGLGPSLGFIPAELHFRGMVVALALTGICLACFIGGIQRDLRQREAELHLSHERLAREERFASIATLAAGVAHELATPLGTIALVSRELEHAIDSTCGKFSCLEDARLIRREVDRCRAIIDRLNADSAVDLGAAHSPLALDAIPALLHSELPPEIAARFQHQSDPAHQNHHLAAPRLALLQALGVLLKNAAEADPAGRPVHLHIRPLTSPGATAPFVVFAVRDQGPGIAPAIAERIGEPFLTTKPPGQGMGLGLYIVRLFAERLRGRLEHEALPSGGTEARLILPLAP